jgi:hypothetical protein
MVGGKSMKIIVYPLIIILMFSVGVMAHEIMHIYQLIDVSQITEVCLLGDSGDAYGWVDAKYYERYGYLTVDKYKIDMEMQAYAVGDVVEVLVGMLLVYNMTWKAEIRHKK